MRDRGPGEGRERCVSPGQQPKNRHKVTIGRAAERAGAFVGGGRKKTWLASKRYGLRDSTQRTPNLLTMRPKSVIWMLGAERYLPLAPRFLRSFLIDSFGEHFSDMSARSKSVGNNGRVGARKREREKRIGRRQRPLALSPRLLACSYPHGSCRLTPLLISSPAYSQVRLITSICLAE